MDLAAKLKSILSPQQKQGEGNQQQTQQPQTRPNTSQIDVIKQNAETNIHSKDPNDIYAEIWKQEPQQQMGSKNLFNTDPEKFGAAVNGMDFTKSVPKELMEKVLAGDSQALMAVINRVGQNAFSTATISSREMIEHANKQQGGSMEKQIQEAVRSALASQNLSKRNENFSDPTVAPLLQEISGRLRAKYPEATADELSEHSEKMLMMIAQKIVSGSPEEKARQKQQQEVKKSEVFDWDMWAAGPTAADSNQQTDFDAGKFFSGNLQ